MGHSISPKKISTVFWVTAISNKVDHIYHAKVQVFSFDRNNFKNMPTLTPFLHGSDRLNLWRYARDISVTNTRTTQQEKVL